MTVKLFSFLFFYWRECFTQGYMTSECSILVFLFQCQNTQRKKKKHPNIYFVYLNENFGFSFLPSEGQSEIYKKPLQWNGHLIWKNICFVFFLSVSGWLAGWSFVCRVMKCEPVACHLLLFVVWALFLWFLCASFGFWINPWTNKMYICLKYSKGNCHLFASLLLRQNVSGILFYEISCLLLSWLLFFI